MRIMKKKLAKTLLFISALTIFVAGCNGTKQDAVRKYLNSGIEYFEIEDFEKSRVQLRNALQVDPEQVQAHYYLGLIAEKKQDWRMMYARLSKVEELDPSHTEARVKLGYLLLVAKQPDIALEKADSVLGIEENNPDGYIIKASAYLAKGLYDVALEYAEKALAHEGNYSEIVVIKASALHKQGKSQDALALLSSAIEKEDDPLHLLLVRIEVNQELNQLLPIEEDYNLLIQQYPDEKAFYINLAKLIGESGRIHEARGVLENYLTQDAHDSQIKLAIVELLELQDSREASELLMSYISSQPQNSEFRFYLVNKLISENKGLAAIPFLEQMLNGKFEGEDLLKAKSMLAALLFEEGDLSRGQQLVAEVLAEDRQFEPALLARSNFYLKTDKVDAAIADLRVVLRNNPESEQALVMLATAYMTSGSDQLAYDTFRKTLEINPGNPKAVVPVIRSLLEKREIDRSEQIIRSALERSPGNELLMSILAQIKLSQKDIKGAQSLISQIEMSGRKPAFNFYLSGRLAQAQDKYEQAIEEYKEALNHDPGLDRALEGLAYSYRVKEKPEELLNYLLQFKEKNPQNLTSYAELASTYQQLGRDREMLKVIEEGIQADKLWVHGYSMLAQSHLAQGDDGEAINAYIRGLREVPDNLMLKLLLASVYEKDDQLVQAKELYEELLLSHPDHEAVINNLASLLTDDFESPENIKRAVTLTSQFATSNQPYFVDTYAWALVKAGKPALAEPLLKRVVETAPDVAIFQFHYSRALKQLGKVSDAREVLKKAETLASGDEPLLEMVRGDLLEL